jgi:DNA invertase Pin-like site-specific DNA recombinase
MPLPPPSLRRALLAHRPGRGKLYAPEVQAAVVEFARGRRVDGASWKQIATELGLRFETVRRWCTSEGSGRPLKRVEVVDEVDAGGSRLSVVCPSGHRLEGLTVRDAVAVLRALA